MNSVRLVPIVSKVSSGCFLGCIPTRGWVCPKPRLEWLRTEKYCPSETHFCCRWEHSSWTWLLQLHPDSKAIWYFWYFQLITALSPLQTLNFYVSYDALVKYRSSLSLHAVLRLQKHPETRILVALVWQA